MLVTNICGMSTDRSAATRQRLADAALELFEANGYEQTTVNEIAAACGVSHMTFFRYFPTKDSVLLDDPYDPAIARAVAEQPSSLPAIERVARGLLVVSAAMGGGVGADARRRIAVAAGVAELRAGMVENNRATEDSIVAACAPDGSDPLDVRIAAAACLAALSAALMRWAVSEPAVVLGDVVRAALFTVVPSLEAAS
jgi:AcrR family transcriptional regulator